MVQGKCSGHRVGEQVLAEIGDMLYWGMLAASTIGPGSVIVLSKAGADYDLELLWAVLVACDHYAANGAVRAAHGN